MKKQLKGNRNPLRKVRAESYPPNTPGTRGNANRIARVKVLEKIDEIFEFSSSVEARIFLRLDDPHDKISPSFANLL